MVHNRRRPNARHSQLRGTDASFADCLDHLPVRRRSRAAAALHHPVARRRRPPAGRADGRLAAAGRPAAGRRPVARAARHVPQDDGDRGRHPPLHGAVRRRPRPRARSLPPRVGRQRQPELARGRARLFPGDAGHLPLAAGRDQHRGGHQVPVADDSPVRPRGLRARRLQRRSGPGAPRPPAARDAAVHPGGRAVPQHVDAARAVDPPLRVADAARDGARRRRLVESVAAARHPAGAVADAQPVPRDAGAAGGAADRLPAGAALGPAGAARRRLRRVPHAARRQHPPHRAGAGSRPRHVPRREPVVAAADAARRTGAADSAGARAAAPRGNDLPRAGGRRRRRHRPPAQYVRLAHHP